MEGILMWVLEKLAAILLERCLERLLRDRTPQLRTILQRQFVATYLVWLLRSRGFYRWARSVKLK